MGRNRIKDKREGEREQNREAEAQNAQEANEAKEEGHIRFIDTSIIASGDQISDRPNSEFNNEHGNQPETAKESIEVNGENEQTLKQNIQENLNKLQSIIPNWQSFLSSLGNPQNWFLTKEDFEVIKAYFTEIDANINANVMEYLRTASNDPCSIHKAIQFLVIRKIGTIQLQSISKRYDTLLEMLKTQAGMYTTALQQIGTLAQSFAQAHAPPVGSLPNLIYDIKLDALIATTIASLTAIGIEIGNIKNNIRTLINTNEFCVRSCNPNCPDQFPIIQSASINRIVNEHEDKTYNEGVEFAKETETVLRLVEELMELELAYAKTHILKNRVKKNNEQQTM
jgi:hypothetical protein